MFPNPQDALPLPARANLEQYKKLAKDLVRLCKSGNPDAWTAWSRQWIETLVQRSELTTPPGMPVRIGNWVVQFAEFARRKLWDVDGKRCVLADAQLVLARAHGFESWPKFARHIDGLQHGNSTTSNFEAAADAIVNGDTNGVLTYVLADPELVRVRSTREHNATLLHYVAANGVEGWRQKTPANVVEIAEALLDHGAEIDATARMYGGDCTTLGLAATSVHPERAGVQVALLALLLDRGARMDLDNSAGNAHSLVKACLANGRGKAAEFLAARGAPLDLETACGVGAIEFVKAAFDADGKLTPDASPESSDEQLRHGFLWACQFGRNRVVEFLLDRGLDLRAQDAHGQTALHHAVIGAQLETMKLLLRHGAPLETSNEYGGTVLGQAIWSASNASSPAPYLPIIEELLAAGAKVEPGTEDHLTKLFKRRPI